MEINPIGFFRTRKKNPYEAARQGAVESSDEVGEIHLLPGHLFEQALDGIEGFSHLWVLFQFHHNQNWKPKVLPPRGSEKKIGVFATRSPYRPNSLGLTCLELIEKNGLRLKVRNFDLLDETPIFDIKPYIAYADSFPQARMGWLEGIDNKKYQITLLPQAELELALLQKLGLSEISNFLTQQLSFDPVDSDKKRVQVTKNQNAILSYRTWRIEFRAVDKKIEVLRFYSGYTAADLSDTSDPYQDKKLHRDFIEWQIRNS